MPQTLQSFDDGENVDGKRVAKFELEFELESYGFRPGKRAQPAVNHPSLYF